jgi:hypothetical protein
MPALAVDAPASPITNPISIIDSANAGSFLVAAMSANYANHLAARAGDHPPAMKTVGQAIVLSREPATRNSRRECVRQGSTGPKFFAC